MILHKTASVEVKSEGRSRNYVQVAIKVLGQSGVEETYLVQEIGENWTVKDLKGWLIDKNGKCHELKKENVAEVDVEDAAGYYDDMRQLVAAFPDVRTGDVVAYQYTVEEKGGWEACYHAFTFQGELPVRYASFDVTVPSGWKYYISARNLEGVNHSVEGSTLSWSYSDLAHRPGEPLMPPWKYVSRRIQFNCYDPQNDGDGHFPDWRRVIQWAADIHADRAVPDASFATEVGDIIGQATSPWERFRVIAEYVRDRVRYVGVEIGEGRFQPRTCSDIWSNKYGDCKDKVTLMRAMLEVADIPSLPVLACTGAPIDPDLPTPLQFNHVIIAVPLDVLADVDGELPASHDGWLFFDPTDEAIPPGWLPHGLHGSHVLKLSEKDSTLTKLPHLKSATNKRLYRVNAVLNEDLSIYAKVRVLDYGIRSFTVAYDRSTKSLADNASEWRELFAETMHGPELSNISNNADSDSAWIEFELTADNYLKLSGGYGLLNVDFFHPDEPFKLKAKERIHPVWFGGSGSFETDITWTWPDTWIANEFPADVSDSCATAMVLSTSSVDGNTVRMVTSYNRTGYAEEIDEYTRARSFYRKLRAAYESRIIFNKD